MRDKNRLLLIRRKTERIVLIKNESEQTLPISKRNLAENPAIKKIKEKFLLANIAGEPRVNNEGHTRHTHDECRFKDSDSSSTHHKPPNLGKAPSKKKDHKSKGDVKSPAPAQVANNNGRKYYICNDPNHLANACPQKGKHKQNTKAKRKGNKRFLTLFKSSFPSLDQQACATRMIDTWDEDI